MRNELELELKVGLFVSIGIGLVMLAILALGGQNSIFTRQVTYTTHFPEVEGLIPGAKVVLAGLTVGVVETADFDLATKDVAVTMSINRKYQDWIRQDTYAEITTQGVLGDKYIDLSTGSQDQPRIPESGVIPSRPPKDLSAMLSKSDQLIMSLNNIAKSMDHILKSFDTGGRSEQFFLGLSTTAKNLGTLSGKLNEGLDERSLRAASLNLKGILEKINNGTGTLGALVNDPGLYDDVKSLVGGANRSRVVRNLVRKAIRDSEKKEQK